MSFLELCLVLIELMAESAHGVGSILDYVGLVVSCEKRLIPVMEISILCLIDHFSVASQSAPQAVFGRLLSGGSLDWLKQPSLIFCVTILTNNFTAFF